MHTFAFAGPENSAQMRAMRDFAATSRLNPEVVCVAAAASMSGLRLSGSLCEAYVSHLAGVVLRSRNPSAKPSYLHISDAGLPTSAGRSRLWIRGDTAPFEIPYPERRRTVSVSVPISSVAFDLRRFDLGASTEVDAPAIAIHVLHSLAEMAASDVTEWIAASPEAIDKYLIGIVSLIISAIYDQQPYEYIEHDRASLRMQVRAIIEEHFTDPGLAPATIALKLGVSLRSLHRAFEGGPGVAAELRNRRVTGAASMLSDVYGRHLTINEVARRAGFASIATFDRTFRNAHGVSPHRYRDEAIFQAAADPRFIENALSKPS